MTILVFFLAHKLTTSSKLEKVETNRNQKNIYAYSWGTSSDKHELLNPISRGQGNKLIVLFLLLPSSRQVHAEGRGLWHHLSHCCFCLHQHWCYHWCGHACQGQQWIGSICECGCGEEGGTFQRRHQQHQQQSREVISNKEFRRKDVRLVWRGQEDAAGEGHVILFGWIWLWVHIYTIVIIKQHLQSDDALYSRTPI